MSARPGLEVVVHRFRSKVLNAFVLEDRIFVCTERGIYRLDKNGKRWRKLKPFSAPTSP